ncbi:BCCT family transporter [Halococcus thailandensis]|uniref:Glycine betaine transporter n=1 Tax=Halococcus thailandensis JCM 13552 TaxID=1227457 RepID=M0N0Z4_9EURY|nr:BCCT family transporter [Halococcus thailandensis]EMA51228.1 glycine betaine transporter [Halococcus thailandensis JCM 13552]
MADAEHDEAMGEMSEGLQVELFHPDSEREPGDTNRQLLGGRFDIHPIVFPGALLLIGLFIAITLLMGQEQASSVFVGLRTFLESTFGWFYIIAVNVFLFTILYFTFSKYGSIRIGGVEAEKEFSTFSWMAMLFSAGMGIGLMFYSVAEPMLYFGSPPVFFGAEAETGAAGAAAMAQTIFHWGLSPWAIYGLVGLGLAFFSFNRGLPLTFRSIFWPLLGERIYGWPGHVIDLVSVFATLFGLCTSLGLGVAQVNTGLSYVFGSNMLGVLDVPTGTLPQIALIVGITAIAVLSVAAGLDGGVKRLSTVNLYLMFALLGFLLIVGPTLYIAGTFSQGLGAYIGNFLSLTFFTGAIGAGGASSLATTVGDWTVFYWGWWIAWSPFVGMFIARISKGRTVREFVVGVLVLPTLFSAVWLSAFGGSALFNSLYGNGQALAAYNELGQTVAMFSLLEQFPLGAVSGLLATLLVITFFVTSSDSGSLVIDHLTSGGKHDVPRTQRVFWASLEGVVAAVLLWGGGLTALQAAAISTALPFTVILLLMCYTVYLGLRNEYEILESEEFRGHIEEISDREDVAVDSSGGDVVTDISDSSDTTTDD